MEYGWYFEQLYVNGRRAVRARSPNEGLFFLKNASQTVINKGSGRGSSLAVQKLFLTADAAREVSAISNSDYKDVVITFYHKWDNTIKHMLGYESDSSAIFTLGVGMKSWNRFDRKTHFFLENYKAALDTAGEWYLDHSGILYYIPRPDENIQTAEIWAPVTDQFIRILGDKNKKVTNIIFEGLSFRVSGYHIPESGVEPAQAASPEEAVIMADFVSNIDFVNCEIANTGTNAIWFRKGCDSCRIEHCYLHDLGAGGVKIGDFILPENHQDLTHNIIANNNIIQSGGFVFPSAVGIILFHTSDDEITHNDIGNFRYSGVSAGWIWGYSYSPSKRNKIEYNHIHHLGWGVLSDLGGVYTLGKSEGTSVSHNVIDHVCSFDYGGWGLYTDEGSTGIVMEDNLVYQCKSAGFHQHYGENNIIRNNIFAGNIKAQLQATRVEDHLSFTFTNNIIWYSQGDLLANNWVHLDLKSDYNAYWDTGQKMSASENYHSSSGRTQEKMFIP